MVGRDLHDRRVVLPSGLPDPEGIAIVAFQQWHQPEVDRWVEALRAHAPLSIVEIPVISAAFRPIARFVARGMRSGIPGDEDRARTITVYGSQRELARLLGSGTHRPIVIAYRAGTVVGVAQGDPAAPEARQLAALLT